jgi:hypothetical protein
LFPTPFTNEVLENVKGLEAYPFTNGFSVYHKVQIIEEDQSKTTFLMEWGSLAYTVIHPYNPFGIKNAPAVFYRMVVATFKKFIHKFIKV